MNDSLTRRRLLQIAAAAGASPLAACALGPSTADMPPIVFVPGNGDSAAIWMTTIWRFESNGWPRDRLHAIDLPYPLARDDDTKLQAGRTSAAEHMAFLAAEVKKVRAATGASKVALIGNSRGGYAIRNFIVNGGGATQVSHVVLAGVPNHGVYADSARNPGNEFNGAGPFLSALNRAGSNGGEVTTGIAWMTIRSDHEDKYAQPDGAAFGAPGMATHVGYDGPALAGAENIVIAGLDHRETAFSAKSFAEMFRFIAGRPATTLAIVPEATVILDGTVSGLGLENQRGDFATNLPLVGAKVEVYATRADTGARVGTAAHRKTIGADGRWGPFHADGATPYEFVIEASGYMTTHVYRSPFPRSSSVVSLHPERLPAGDRTGTSLIVLTRPRGYFGVPRDRITLDGTSPPAGIPRGVPTVATVRLKLNEITGRPVVAQFNDERIVGRAWPLVENQIVVLELTS